MRDPARWVGVVLGENRWGQLGVEDATDRRTVPGAVFGVAHATPLAAGILHTCAVTLDGTAWC